MSVKVGFVFFLILLSSCGNPPTDESSKNISARKFPFRTLKWSLYQIDSTGDTKTIHYNYWSIDRRFRSDLYLTHGSLQQTLTTSFLALNNYWYEWYPDNELIGYKFAIRFEDVAYEPIVFVDLTRTAIKNGTLGGSQLIDGIKCYEYKLQTMEDGESVEYSLYIDTNMVPKKIFQKTGTNDVVLTRLFYPIIFDASISDSVFELPSKRRFRNISARRIDQTK